MLERLVSYFGFTFVVLIIILANIQYIPSNESRYIRLLLKEHVGDEANTPYITSTSSCVDDIYINQICDKTRSKIKYEITMFNVSFYGAKHEFNDLVMESVGGGRPLRNLIISTWRSGTTFLGELLNAIPGTYYHYEPLHVYGHTQIRGPPKDEKALRTIMNLLKCNYLNLKAYINYGKKNLFLYRYNTRVWEQCKFMNDLCYNHTQFMSRICKLFPFQAMKLVRLRLHLMPQILDDKELNVKVILLIRDPRGVMQSRQPFSFCKKSSDCWDPLRVCGDMISDYMAASRILQQYPDRLMIVRYEDLTLEPYITSHRILKFLHISATQSVRDFVQGHTNVDSSTYPAARVSRDVPFKWKNALNFSHVNAIQKVCKEAMFLWGYKMAHNNTHMKSKDFNPIEQRWRSFKSLRTILTNNFFYASDLL